MDFVKDHEALYDKTSEHFKVMAGKEFLWQQFAKSHKLSVNVCETWFDLQRTCFGKLTQSKYGQALNEDDGMSDLDIGQVRISEVAHYTQGAQEVLRLQSTQHLQSLD